MGQVFGKKVVETPPEEDNYSVKLSKEDIENIRKLVAQMLKNPDVNTIIPDVIEKKIYENLLIVMFAHLKNVVSNFKVEFLGNELTVSIKPIDKVDPKPQ